MRNILYLLALGAAVMSSCTGPDCGPFPRQDPDDVTGGPYEVGYKLWFDGATEVAVEGIGEIYLGPGVNGAGEPVELLVAFSPRGGVEGRESVSLLESGLVELEGAPGNYSVSGSSGDGSLGLYKEGAYNLHYYDAEVSVSGKVTKHAVAATRCSPVMQTPDMYHDIELVIEASVDGESDGEGPGPRSVRLEVFPSNRPVNGQ